MTPEYTWREFTLPAGLAQEYKSKVQRTDSERRLLRTLHAFAWERNVPEIAECIDGNVPAPWLDGE